MTRFSTPALVCLASVSLFVGGGCGRQEEPKAASPTRFVMEKARAATPQETSLVPDGLQLISPDSGKQVVKGPQTPALVYEGRLYFVCCPACLQKCLASPSLLKGVVPPNGFLLKKLGGAGA